MLGASQAVPGLIYATAHYRNGVMFAPLTVQLVGDLVFDRDADPALRDLDPRARPTWKAVNAICGVTSAHGAAETG